MFAKQSREASLGTPFLGGVFFESSSDLESSGGALAGANYVMPDTSPEFRIEYAKLGTTAPGSIAWSAVFYDVGRILCSSSAAGMERLNFLRSINNLPGAVGKITFRSKAGVNTMITVSSRIA